MEHKLKSTSRYYAFVLIICVQFILNTAMGQRTQLKFENYQVQDGLPDDIIISVLQDSKGFMWFGTYNGLARFDGNSFRIYRYNDKDPHSVGGNIITTLCEDHTGKIWVGSSMNAVSVYDPKSDTFTQLKGGENDSLLVTNSSVRVIIEDTDHFIWVGTDYGLSMISPDRKTSKHFFAGEKSINNNIIYDLLEDKNRNIWIATENSKLSLYSKKDQSFSEVKYTDIPLHNNSDNLLKRMCLSSNGTLWVVSNHGGLSGYNLASGLKESYLPSGQKDGIRTSQVRDVIQVGNTLWLATEGEGVEIFDLETKIFSNYKNSRHELHTITSDVIWTVYKDNQDNVWIGTYHGGLNKYDPRNNFFKLINDYSVLPANKPILSMYQDKSDNLYVGTDWGGMYVISPSGKVKHYLKGENSLSTNVVKAIDEDSAGNLLLGTFDYGFSVFDPQKQTFKHYKHQDDNPNSLPSNNVWAIYTDSKQISWIATLGGGVAIYDPKTQSITIPKVEYPVYSFQQMYHIYEDSQTNLWFSTDAGLLFFDRRMDQWKAIPLDEKFGVYNPELNKVKATFEDKLGNIWAATGAGLVKYTPSLDKYVLFDLSNGLPEVPIYNMCGDGFGNLLITTKTYISQFDLSKENIINYLVKDNVLGYNSILTKDNNQILIGGRNGITAFDAKRLRKNTIVPPVHFTEFRIFNRVQLPTQNNSVLKEEISCVKRIDIDYEQSVIEFKWSALNYTETNLNQYAYKLEGFDKEWNYVNNRNSVTYTNLDPGKYRLTVRGSNNHHVWNEEGASIDLYIHPPFWKTIWFKTISLILLVSLLYFIQRFRLEQIKRKFQHQQLQKEKEMSVLHNKTLESELNTTKSELDSITMSFIHNNQKLQKIRQKISDNIEQADSNSKTALNRIVKEIDREMQNNDYWDKFEHQFNKSHDNFLKRFKQTHPDLSKRELRICAYLRMGLDNQEISTIMNVTAGTIGTSRYRIRKKIGLEDRISLTKMITRF